MRLRLACQRTAIWSSPWDPAHWIKHGELRTPAAEQPVENDPAVLVAQEQIRKDGRLIVEHVTAAVDAWHASFNRDPPGSA
jgi:hypothetical protein